MSGFGRSSSSSQANTTSNTLNTSTNVNVQPSGANSIGIGQARAGGDIVVNNVATDSGAVSGALGFAQSALASNADLSKSTIDAAKQMNLDAFSLVKNISANVTDFASETNKTTASTALSTTQNALQFGERAFGTVDSALQRFSTSVNDAYKNSADIQNNALSTAADAFRSAAGTQSTALSTVASGVQNALQVAAASTSSTYASTQTVKYVLYGLGAVAIAIAIIFASRK